MTDRVGLQAFSSWLIAGGITARRGIPNGRMEPPHTGSKLRHQLRLVVLARRVAIRAAPEHAVTAGFCSVTVGRTGREAEFQQLTDGGRPRRHTVLESEIVDQRQLIR